MQSLKEMKTLSLVICVHEVACTTSLKIPIRNQGLHSLEEALQSQVKGRCMTWASAAHTLWAIQRLFRSPGFQPGRFIKPD